MSRLKTTWAISQGLKSREFQENKSALLSKGGWGDKNIQASAGRSPLAPLKKGGIIGKVAHGMRVLVVFRNKGK